MQHESVDRTGGGSQADPAVGADERAAEDSRTLLEEEIQRAVGLYGEVVDANGAQSLTGLAKATLAGRRSDPRRGPHPPYLRIGRAIRYRTADLVPWVFERRLDATERARE